MLLPDHKTKIVCTIGPSSESKPVLQKMMQSGMNVARLNLAHGDFDEHRRRIRTIRSVAEELKVPIAILLDLPGPKIRIGRLPREPIMLKPGDMVTLTTGASTDEPGVIPVDFEEFPSLVSENSTIYLADGFIQLRVQRMIPDGAVCIVVIGGLLSSHKGMNLLGASLAVETLTERDREGLAFGIAEGVDAFSVSFIRRAEDVRQAREYAESLAPCVRIIAKIERREAVENVDEILAEADGVMIARGDLGVQIPIEEVPVVQKRIIHQANISGRPVITATQMLESMTEHIRPTRAEVTDVANAILDGTDAVMLSGETAIGSFPVETVQMMAGIARTTEEQRRALAGGGTCEEYFRRGRGRAGMAVGDVVSLNVIEARDALRIQYIITPTRTGSTPRRISRFKPEGWILSFSRNFRTPQFLSFSYGVQPFFIQSEREDWHEEIMEFLKASDVIAPGDRVLFTEGVSPGEAGTDSLTILTVE
ncbi:pyruvate kinase [Methanoculleus sp. FWC-SCC1]|uniref:Pyruvate kinase n=1 Tax=Methanoculleus frigidifontis TaxID=2584085 RepID=A0ABT8MB39_9EURY|nr:pyruvate kinase [Methanoculleus sp. FWC-SCC1]MDN7025150.1 pyruvate kinase [Methanoculleus sp. FWC-SCC1]